MEYPHRTVWGRAARIAIWLVILLALVAFFGSRLGEWRQVKRVTTTSSSSPGKNAPKKASPSPSEIPEPTPTPIPSGAFTAASEVSIADLGFKFPIPAELSGLSYSYDVSGNNTMLHFSTKSLESASGNDGLCTASHDPLGSVLVLSSKSMNPGGTDSQDGVLIASPGGKYIYWHSPQGSCSADKSVMTRQANQSDALKWSLQHASAL
jgi:hypothetical protein